MSDKNNIKVQNRGWKAMEKVLDKELPQKSRKRPLLWVFFLIGVGVLSYLAIPQNNKTIVEEKQFYASLQEETNAKFDLKAIEQDKGVERTKTSSQNSEKQVLNDVMTDREEIRKELSFVSENTEKVQGQSYSSQADFQKPKVDKVDDLEPSVGLESQTRFNRENEIIVRPTGEDASNTTDVVSVVLEGPQVLIDKDETIGKSIKKEEINIVEELENKIESKNIATVVDEDIDKTLLGDGNVIENEAMNMEVNNDKVKNIENEYLEDVIASEEEINVDPLHSTSNYRKIQPYIFGSGISLIQSNRTGLGYTIGAGFQYNMNIHSFYVEGGYKYLNYKTSGENSGDLIVEPTGDDLEIENGVGSNVGAFEDNKDTISINNFNSLLSSISSVQLEAGLITNVYKGLSLTLGVNYSRFVSQKNKSFEYVASAPLNNTASYNISSKYLEESNVLSEYDVAPVIGIGYALKNFEISARYNHGLRNVIMGTSSSRVDLEPLLLSSESNEKNYNRTVDVKLKYKF